MLLIIISFTGIFYGKEAVEGEIYHQINGFVRSEAAIQIQSMIRNISHAHHDTIGATIGVIVLIIGATGVFTEIQGSINYIWSVKAEPEKGWLKFLLNRLISFSLVVSMGFILLVSLIISALMEILSDNLKRFFKDYTVYLFHVVDMLLVFLVITGLFAVIFKVLPDAKIKETSPDRRWVHFFTLLLGKFVIGFYLGKSDVGIAFGTATSIIVILYWIYYSSLILYFGAEFTKLYAIETGRQDYAYRHSCVYH